MAYDKRAVKILFDTYWGPKGWKAAASLNWRPETPPEDLAYAMDAGMMFAPHSAAHDETIERIKSLAAALNPRDVGTAFIAGLAKGVPALASALGSFSVAITIPRHRFSPAASGVRCTICGGYGRDGQLDLNILNFERHKWGGVRHTEPTYVAFDLERFTAERVHTSAVDDARGLGNLLRATSEIPTGSKCSELLRGVRSVIPGNDYHRLAILEKLALADVIRIRDHPGFLRTFTPANLRKETPWTKDDWPYPLRWWQAGEGVDVDAERFWFGEAFE